jgi:osmoprotectant transport system permease protein
MAADEPLVRWDWVSDHTDDITAALREHVGLTAVAVTVGFAISLVLALVAVRWRWTYEPLAGICSVLYAIPSLALFGVLVSIPFFGLGFRTAEVALVSYTLLILLRNIVAGLDGVQPPVREAADGMGFEGWRRLVRVDLPLATPSIVAGLRIATVTTVGLVTVTSLVGEGGFGRLINDGLGRNFPTPIVVGAVGSILLAIAFDVLFVAIERLITPWARAGRPAGAGRAGWGRRRRGHGAPADTTARNKAAETWPATARAAGAGAGGGPR